MTASRRPTPLAAVEAAVALRLITGKPTSELRDPICLLYFAGPDQSEVARVLDVPVARVRERVARALRMIGEGVMGEAAR